MKAGAMADRNRCLDRESYARKIGFQGNGLGCREVIGVHDEMKVAVAQHGVETLADAVERKDL